MAALACPAPGARRAPLAVRPLRPAPRPPEGLLDAAWASLRAAVAAAFGEEEPAPGAREEAYRLVETLCLNGQAASLARRLSEECTARARARLRLLAPAAAAPPGSGAELLERLQGAWAGHCRAMLGISEVFLYLNQTHLRGHPEGAARCLEERGTQIFRQCLAELPEVQERAVLLVLDLIDSQRRGQEDAAGPSPAPYVSMLLRLGIYEDCLEPGLVRRTAEFYRVESEELLGRTRAPAYLLHCERRLNEEQARCAEDLEGRSAAAVLAAAREELWGRHCGRVLEADLGGLVAQGGLENLGRLHRLCGQVGTLPLLCKSWGASIRCAGAAVLAVGDDPEESKNAIPGLVSLRAKLFGIVDEAFQGCSTFRLATKAALEELLGRAPQNRPAKLLARYLDEVLRGERGRGDEEVDAIIAGAIGIFSHLAAKDAFEAFFRKDLARRLLHHICEGSSAGAELAVIQRLSDECGAGFCSKLKGMLRDVDLSLGLRSAFASRPAVQTAIADAGVELDVSVLASGLWPAPPRSPDVVYPQAVARLQELFATFYAQQHTGRSLSWAPSLGQCVLRAAYQGDLRKEFVVSHLQAIVLLLFNGADTLSCQQIARATGIPAADLQRTLQSLALHKTVKLLSKDSKVRDVLDGDLFTFNSRFSHKLFRITVPQIFAKDQAEEEQDVEHRVLKDRLHEIDAAVVRVMKAQKRLTHQQLLSEVFKAIGFPATPSDVKQRIESLIERDYLERDAGSGAAYNYLA